MDKILPEQFGGMIKKFGPVLSLAGIPKPETMLAGIADKLDAMPLEFWIELEDNLIGIIQDDPASEAWLMNLLGIKT